MQTIIADCGRGPSSPEFAVTPNEGRDPIDIDTIAVQPSRPATRRRRQRPRRRRPGRRRVWRALAAVVLVILALTAGGWAALPHFLPSFLEKLALKRLGLPTAIGRTDLLLSDRRLVLANITVGQGENLPDAPPLFVADRIVVAFALDLLQGPRLEHVEVDDGRLSVIRFPDRTTNLAQIWPRLAAAGNGPGVGLRLVNAKIDIDDRLKKRRHQIDNLYLELPPLTGRGLPAVLAGQAPLPSFRARINGSPVALAGRLERDKATGNRIRFQIAQIDLANYLPYLPPAITAILTGGTAAADLSLGLERGEVTLRGAVVLQEPTVAPPLSGTAASARIEFSVQMTSRSVTCERLVLTQPRLTVMRKGNGWQLPGLAQPTDASPQWRFTLGAVTVEDGSLEIVDQAIAGGFSLRLTGVQATLAPNGALELTGKSRLAGPVRLQGVLSPGERRFRGEMRLARLDLADLSAYLRTAAVQKGRLTGISGQVVVGKEEQRLSGLRFAAANFVCLLPQGRLLLRQGKVNGMEIDFRRQTIAIERLTVGRSTPLSSFWPASNSANKKGPPQTPTWRFSLQSAVIEAIDVLPAGNPTANAQPSDTTPLFRLEDLQVLDYDSAARTPTCRVAATLLPAAGGTFQFSGTLQPHPLRLQGRGMLDGLPLAPYQRLLLPRLEGRIRQGTLRGRGSFAWPNVTFAGDLAVRDLVLDHRSDRPLLAWQEAQAQGVRLDSSLFSCRSLTIDRPRATWRLTGRGRSNLSGLFGEKNGKNDKQPFAITIDEMVFRGGQLQLADERLSPPLRLFFQQVDGTIASLANRPENRCQIQVQGQGPQGSTLAVNGRIGFFAPQLTAQCTITAHALPLTLFAPYLAAELGHEIAGGTLDITSRYQRQNGKIDAENELVIHDLSLGKPLRPISHLPLTLALLTDSDGALRLSLPVHGDLTDANFSFRTTLFGVLRNLLLQTAVTPFTMLKKLLPDVKGPDLSWVEFAAGSATLDKTAQRRLQALAKTLSQRPALALTIVGQADLGRDRLALATKRRQQQLEARFAQQERLARQLANRYRGEELATSLPPPAKEPAAAGEVTEADLRELGRKRAEAVAAFLQAQGIDGQRLTVESKVELVPEGRLGRPGTSVRLRPTTAESLPAYQGTME